MLPILIEKVRIFVFELFSQYHELYQQSLGQHLRLHLLSFVAIGGVLFQYSDKVQDQPLCRNMAGKATADPALFKKWGNANDGKELDMD